ncbi:MAG: T9SS type A sorting domain-containing protein [Candidatus Margulisbacteria bacterium]|nr:T9SS type A sorting domain-containing protein [Candidatus Margulisiibacteriota bacterium]
MIITKKSLIISILFFSLASLSAEDLGYVPGKLLIKTKKTALFSTAMTNKNLIPLHLNTHILAAKSQEGQTYLLTFSSEQDAKEIAKTYAQQSDIEYAEPLYYVQTDTMPNDPNLDKQTDLSRTSLKSLLTLTPIQDTLVAVLDTGIDITHPDLQGQLYTNPSEISNNGLDDDHNGYIDDISGYNFSNEGIGNGSKIAEDQNGHGTHLAGIIAAKTNNNLGITGLNPRTKILNCKFLDASGRGTQLDAAIAIYYAVNQGAKIINCSWGYTNYNTVLQNAIAYAIAHDVVVIAAAGNSGIRQLGYPAAFPKVVAVGSIDLNQHPSYFSSQGTFISYSTYGENIYSLAPHCGYAYRTGTSQSTAILSGIISLIYSIKPELSSTQVQNLLNQSLDDISPTGKDIYTGYGSINGAKLATILGGASPNEDPSVTSIPSPTKLVLTDVMNFPNPATGSQTKFGFTSTLPGDVVIKVHALDGRLLRTLTEQASENGNVFSFDLKNETGTTLQNGTYFYTITLATSDNQKTRAKGKLSIMK